MILNGTVDFCSWCKIVALMEECFDEVRFCRLLFRCVGYDFAGDCYVFLGSIFCLCRLR